MILGQDNGMNSPIASYYVGDSGVKTNYFVSTHSTVGVKRGSNLNVTLDDFVLQQVLAPSTTGLTVVSALGGSTYNWTSDDGIAPNSASFALTITRD
jgi:hypothetical protein